MLMFNLVFIVALIIACTNVHALRYYTTFIHKALIIANAPIVRDALNDNKHFNAHTEMAREEYAKYQYLWLPLSAITLGTVLASWWFGITNGGELSSINIALLVLFLSASITQTYTRELPATWLLLWNAGVQSVLIAAQIEALEQQLEDIGDEGNESHEVKLLRAAINALKQKD